MNLRREGFRGGVVLGSREAVGIVVRLAGVLVLTRLIGPSAYGIYAGCLAVVYLLTTAAQLGTEAYLMRLPEAEADDDRFHEAFSMVTIASALVTTGAVLAIVVLAALTDASSYAAPFAVLCISIPINALWAPSQALIERALRYRAMAMLELGGDVVLYAVAVPLAITGAGVWAPVAGWIAAQTWVLVGSAVVARFRPRWRWHAAHVRDMVRFGSGYAGGSWVLNHPAEIVAPLVIGPQLGAAAVGQVMLVLRLIDTLGFVQRAARRMALVLFARVQHDAQRFARAVEDAAVLQLIAFGAPLVGFGFVADRLVPVVFGDDWRGATAVYPAFAFAALVTAASNVSAYALNVRKQNAPVVTASAAQLVALLAGAMVLVPDHALTGLGVARLVAVLAIVWLPLHLRSRLPITLGTTVVWTIAFAPSFAVMHGAVAFKIAASFALLLPLVVPGTRRHLASLASMTRRGDDDRPLAVAPGLRTAHEGGTP